MGNRLLVTVTRGFNPSLIHVEMGSVLGPRDRSENGAGVKCQRKQFLALAKFLLSPLALSDVGSNADNSTITCVALTAQQPPAVTKVLFMWLLII
jgi:hypothetical protein